MEKTCKQYDKEQYATQQSTFYAKLKDIHHYQYVSSKRVSYFIKTRLLQRIIIWNPEIYETITSKSTKYSIYFRFK